MIRLEGYFLDGVSSKRYRAHLEVLADSPDSASILINDTIINHKKHTLPTHALSIQSRLGNTPREITFRDNQLFVTDDNEGVDQLAKQLGSENKSTLLHRIENNLLAILIACVATVALTWGMATYGIPAAAKQIAFNLPEITQKMGSSLVILDKLIFKPSKLSAQRQQEIQKFTKPIFNNFPELQPTLFFRSGMSANALALPNGEIVLTDDFVKLVKSEDELLAVIYHELGHLQGKHLIRRTLQDSMVTLFVIIITGDLDTLDLLTGLPTLILDLTYSRTFEEEADDFALQAMAEGGIDIENFITVMQRLDNYYKLKTTNKSKNNENNKIKTILSTHPLTVDRIEKAKRFKARQETNKH